MKTAITVALLPANPRRPFVLGPDLPAAFTTAVRLGFNAIELFPPTIESLDLAEIKRLVREYEIPVSTIGTGGGAVSQGLTFTDPDPEVRQQAFDYAAGIIRAAGELNASAIIGSMQGRAGDRPRGQVLEMLTDQLSTLAELANQHGQPLFVEPLNRYESDLLNKLDDVAQLAAAGNANLQILADLFHMNIEETNVLNAIEQHFPRIGHVHFVDSNRWPAGNGHADLLSVVEALHRLNYRGYLAVEALPLPDPESAATQAALAFRQLGVSPSGNR